MIRRKTGPTQAVIDLVLDRAQGKCEKCGVASGEQLHHRHPRRMGGTRRPEINLASNLLLLDAQCHFWIEHNRTAALDLGLLLPDGANPRAESVELWNGRCFLDDRGGFEPPDTNALEA